MPFTFAHPAVVLPLINKRWKFFSSTGLVVGSMTPDFEAFIRVDVDKIYSHSWKGMFWFDLPLSIIICLIFHAIVREPLIANLPRRLRQRFEQYRQLNWLAYFKKHFLVVITSLLLGIGSHLLLDAFTHLNLRYPDSKSSTVMFDGVRIYILLQYTVSVVGLIAITWAVLSLPKTKIQPGINVSFSYWIFVILVSILTWALITTTFFNDTIVDIILLIDMVIASFFVALIVVSLFYKIWRRLQT